MSLIKYPKGLSFMNLLDIPFDIQIIIFEYLDYKYRTGMFIRQIPKNLRIFDLLRIRKESNPNGLKISFDINFKDYHNDYVVKTLEIEFSRKDRNIFIKKNNYYAIDYNGERYSYEPSVTW